METIRGNTVDLLKVKYVLVYSTNSNGIGKPYLTDRLGGKEACRPTHFS